MLPPEHMTFIAAMTLLLVSPATGAFLKLWADRASENLALFNRASSCDHCGKPLRSRDLVPILSWLMARGKARCCDGRIKPDLLRAEICAVLLATWGILAMPDVYWLQTLIVAYLLQGIALLSAPDRIAAAGLAIILTSLALVWSVIGLLGPNEEHLLGALVGGSLAAFGILDRLRGAPTHLLLPAGALLGVAALPSALFLGLGIALLHRCWTYKSSHAGTPYTTSLAIGLAGGIWLVWLYGPTLGL